MDALSRLCLGLAALMGLLVPSLFWFDGVHILSAAWPPHSKFHLLWQAGFSVLVHGVALGLVLVAWRAHARVPQLVAALCLSMWVAFLVAAYGVAPLVGIEDPFPHAQERVLGIRSNVLGVLGPFFWALVGGALGSFRGRPRAGRPDQ